MATQCYKLKNPLNTHIIPFIKQSSIACLHQPGVSTKQIAPPHCWFARKAHNSLFTQSMSLVGNASCLVRDAADICKCVCGHEYTQIQYVIGCIYMCINCYFGQIVLSKHSRATVCKLYEKQIYHSKYEMVKCLCKCH